jgi:predicted alpha/beta-fold hydrolase
VPTPDGDSVDIYHVDIDPARPRLLLLHGLEGSIRSHYVAGFAGLAAQHRWNFTLLEFRGCGIEFNRAPRLYHSGETADLDLVVRLLASRSPDQALYLAGVSLGGNVLLKWLGETGEAAPKPVRGAAAVSVPFDLEAGARHLQLGFARVYDRHFLRSLRRKALRKLDQYPSLFDRSRLLAARSIEDFDDAVTGPVHGFAGSHDYYERSSSIHFIGRIRRPTLLLSSRDDPFLPSPVLERVRLVAADNPCLTVDFTDAGGHVGFVTGNSPLRPEYWAERRVVTFLDSL